MKTILLADDSITIQKVVELTFSDGDYRVLCVSNGSQALRKIAEARPDIVLLDVIMPEKNGYEVCEAMKADPATAGIPVLLLTGTFEPFDRQRAEAAGAEGHLTKPFESHTLVARVEELIARAAERAAAPPTRTAAPEPIAAPAQASAGMETTPGPEPAASAAPAPHAAPFAAEGMESGTTAAPAHPFAPLPPAEDTAPAGPHPAFAAPDAAAGGSYMGFADLAIGEDEVIPDRFDSVESPATVRIARASAPEAPVPAPDDAVPALEGYMAGYDMPAPDAAPPAPSAAADREEALGTPPPMTAPAPPVEVGASTGTTAPALPDEDLERLAEMVVRRLSERVVREIAWEVIPGVAEAVVRQRIREIEGEGR